MLPIQFSKPAINKNMTTEHMQQRLNNFWKETTSGCVWGRFFLIKSHVWPQRFILKARKEGKRSQMSKDIYWPETVRHLLSMDWCDCTPNMERTLPLPHFVGQECSLLFNSFKPDMRDANFWSSILKGRPD